MFLFLLLFLLFLPFVVVVAVLVVMPVFDHEVVSFVVVAYSLVTAGPLLLQVLSLASNQL